MSGCTVGDERAVYRQCYYSNGCGSSRLPNLMGFFLFFSILKLYKHDGINMNKVHVVGFPLFPH